MTQKAKKIWLVFVLAVVFTAVIIMGVSFAKTGGGVTPGDGVAGVVLKPFQVAFSFVSDKIGGFFNFITDMKELKEENLELSQKVDILSGENRELESFRTENQRLRELLELKQSDNSEQMIGCEIIAKEPGNWFNIFTVDKGENHGISVNDVVVTAKGLVGRVSETGPVSAKVVAIIDDNSSVGAIVTRTQDIAIVDGELSLSDDGLCRLNYVTSGAKLSQGDIIETSGLGGVYPKGILIGTVTEIKENSSGVSSYAIVKPAVDFERIREVLVIKTAN